AQCLLNTFVGNEAEEGRLLQLDRNALTQRAIEDSVPSRIRKVCDQDGVFLIQGNGPAPAEKENCCEQDEGKADANRHRDKPTHAPVRSGWNGLRGVTGSADCLLSTHRRAGAT